MPIIVSRVAPGTSVSQHPPKYFQICKPLISHWKHVIEQVTANLKKKLFKKFLETHPSCHVISCYASPFLSSG